MFAFVQPWLLAAAVGSVVLLAVVAVRDRRQRSRADELDARDDRLTRGESSLKLLETRAISLREEITQLEEERQALLVIIPEGVRGERLRTQLAGRTTGMPSARATAR